MGKAQFGTPDEDRRARRSLIVLGWLVLATLAGVLVGPPAAPRGFTGQTGTGGPAFRIAGSIENLALGSVSVIPLTLTSANDAPIYVTGLTLILADDSEPPGCPPGENVLVRQPAVSVASPVLVPARGLVVLATAPSAPEITLVNLPGVNQDSCRDKRFILAYVGTARW